jgi:hypothetical protein
MARHIRRIIPVPLIETGEALDYLLERGAESAFGSISDCACYLCEAKLSLLEEIACNLHTPVHKIIDRCNSLSLS